jgi:transmembrane 9 superfamily member 1
LKFLQDEAEVVVCEKSIDENDIDKFSTAIEEEWYGEMYADDLPFYFYVGESEGEDFLIGHTDDSKHYLYTHLHFVVGFNGDKVVSVNVSAAPAYNLDITTHDPTHEEVPRLGSSGHHGHGHHSSSDEEGGDKKRTVKFTYSVQWVESDVSYENRMQVYESNSAHPSTLEIHWLSIINSLVLVILLTAFLAIILLRVIKSDFTRYMKIHDDEAGIDSSEEETGWKLIHGDVFRSPKGLSLFAALIGTGFHLFVTSLVVLSLAVSGYFSLSRRGSIVAAFILVYTLTSGVGTYMSSKLFKQLKGGNAFVANLVLTIGVFPIPFLAVFSVLHVIASIKSSTAALPTNTILVVLILFLFVAIPLSVFGAYAGHTTNEFETPCRVNKVPRQIPAVPFYRSSMMQYLMAGFLPFSAISIELHYIFASLWGHKVYTLYGILLIAFILLALVTAFITIALTYFQLAAEDHHWWWRSFYSGASVGLFIYGYCFFYFFNHSGMYGLLQTAFYFLYMSIAAFAFSLMMGAIGFYSSWLFVRYIYSSIKTD